MTADERALRARIAAHARWAKEDGVEGTAKARSLGPGHLPYWLNQIDPDLPEPERIRRAESMKKAHFLRLALASAKARREKRSRG